MHACVRVLNGIDRSVKWV